MGCEACQDCGCDNVTLPVVTGATGPQGPQGPQGPAGAAGTPGVPGTGGFYVLHNDVVQGSRTNAAIGLFSPNKTYSLPPFTLSIDGSKLNLTSVFSTGTLTDAANAYIWIGGASWTGKSIPYQLYNSQDTSGSYLKIELDITRASKTSLFINSSSFLCYPDGTTMDVYYFSETMTVPDLDVNTLLFEARGKTNGADTLNCDQFTIDHLIK